MQDFYVSGLYIVKIFEPSRFYHITCFLRILACVSPISIAPTLRSTVYSLPLLNLTEPKLSMKTHVKIRKKTREVKSTRSRFSTSLNFILSS